MMDELLKAITNAVRTGTTLAYPVLVSYFALRALDVLAVPVAFICVVRSVLTGVKMIQLVNAKKAMAECIGRLAIGKVDHIVFNEATDSEVHIDLREQLRELLRTL